MLRKTLIEWCDYTWSPWFGCTKVSPGCLNCYAEARDKRHLLGPESHWGKGAPRRITKDWKWPVKFSREPICVKCGKAWPARGMHPDCDGESQDFRNPRAFPSVCDWLDEEVPIDLFVRFLKLIHETQNLDWLLLTKRPEKFFQRLESAWKYGVGTDDQRFQDWLRFWGMNGVPPSNVWVGTSVEDQQRSDERIQALLKIPARIRFLSVEPLLGPVDLFLDWLASFKDTDAMLHRAHRIDWVIVGGESGRNARPCNVAWVRSIVRQCADYRVPCFVKQLGACPVVTVTPGQAMPDDFRAFSHPKGGDPAEWPEDLRVRQFPSR